MTLSHMMYEMSLHLEGFVTDTTDKLTSFPQMKILVVFLHLERGLEILIAILALREVRKIYCSCSI